MTNPRHRELDRAVRAYKRAHRGITLEQARKAVADRARWQPGLPARIPGVPLPRLTERLEGYVQRVAAAAGVQRHRAMELLGLAPGTSATARLDELAAGPLPETAVKALVAATGMTAAQARALTAPRSARPNLDAVRRVTEANFAAGHFRRGGAGKTSSSLSAVLAPTHRARLIDLDGSGPQLAGLLAAADAPRPLLIDTDPAPTPRQALAPLLLGDTSSPFIGQPLLAPYPDGRPQDD
ncbi:MULTISPECIES: hypothetical protein [unclassified Streptomyces]|uniref:Uncharacterized protein n=1 Tax=Streptomyces sp. F12 TaxID=1436084 RepID=V9Z8N8_9ACTN|nr:hypothetical protein [Streptomyces sp. F12]AHE40488.1 hypothetical protein pFRL6_401c [Streptomyces sp. F12]